ncbi:FAD-linked oxidase [Leptobacterium flavescens]|uniref:FAD-linked oxidase n=1 Tax=Leptobacterium flavescens TaxID=472055 RepID=A0A6P0ULY5_9FLAO|nr:FAD-linked oxidase [Leptobacterium flavescens]NER13572.1 FAD-linked oxidase [Leptobacterium flavescens]
MAETVTHPKTEWTTIHKNGPWKLKRLHITTNEGSTHLPSATGRYKDTANEIRRLIGEARDQGEGFRAFGSRWSMSQVAHHPDSMHYNRYMNLHIPVSGTDIHQNSPYEEENLFFFQCGTTIKRISQVLEAHGKSLKTSGASNGQTLAGCMSTGVHGSAIDVGSVQDYVVGINLITGPNPDDNVYLERHSKPALSDSFAQKINARVIRNDELFNAALVSMGGFGFIHGIAIEAEDRFLLQRYVKKIDKEIALELAETMDFRNSPFKIDEETGPDGKGLKPYHYKIFFNPYNDEKKYVVELMYKKPYTVPYEDPFNTIENSIYTDLIYLLIKISEKWPRTIPFFIKRLEKNILPEVNEKSLGTLYETFWDAQYKGPAFAFSVGIDHKDSTKALEVLSKMTSEEGPIPGIFAMRFIKRSEATLSFARFPVTCMLEIDGVQWKKSKKLMSQKEYGRRMIEVLQQNNIPFTLHWGKNSDWSFPGLVDHMFGEDAKKWKAYRNSLLSPEMATVFSNDFLIDTGLDEALPPDPGLIVSLG